MNKRLDSLDILRGLTVFLMIMVNNGVGHEQFVQMQHSKWNGLTVCDLVFPFFLFIVGVSAYLALSKKGFSCNTETYKKIATRTVGLFLIGVALHAWDTCVYDPSLLLRPAELFGTLRIWGVLQYIALCYGIVSIILLHTHRFRWLFFFALVIFVLYALILALGNGYECSSTNIHAIIDDAIFGIAHLYQKSPIDPEGLLGTLPSVAHVLIGASVGCLVKKDVSMNLRLISIFWFGVTLIIVAYLMKNWIPFNKRMWTPTYALVTCGFGAVLLVLLNIKPLLKLLHPFQNIGLHALAAYILSEMLCSIVNIIGINEAFHQFACQYVSAPLSSFLYSLLYATVLCLPFAIKLVRKEKRGVKSEE